MMETRSTARMKDMGITKDQQEIMPPDINNNYAYKEGFESRVMQTLEEVEIFIAKFESERVESQQQIDNLLSIVESQKLHIERMDLTYREQIREMESRLCKLECKTTTDLDSENQTVLLSFIDNKISELSNALEHVQLLEQKLNVKLEETLTHAMEFGSNTRKTSRPIQLPPPYDGTTPWEAYNAQFEIVSQLNDWSQEQKASFLATSLKGNATMVLSNLSQENRQDFNTLAKALENRFGATHQSELARAKFKTRVKKREESLPELASDLERLVKLAYPGAEAELQDTLAKDQFIDALPDDNRIKVRQGRPKNTQAALEIALELESYQLADRWGHIHSKGFTHARQFNLQESSTSGKFKERSPTMESSVESEIGKLGSLVRKVLEEVKQRGQTRRFDRQRLSRCYCCNELGHLQSSCPFNKAAEFQQQRPNNTEPTQRFYSTRGFQQQRQQDATGFPQPRHVATGFPTQGLSTTGFPPQRQDTIGLPQSRQDATGFPRQSQDRTEFSQENSRTSTQGNFQRSSSRGRGRPF